MGIFEDIAGGIIGTGMNLIGMEHGRRGARSRQDDAQIHQQRQFDRSFEFAERQANFQNQQQLADRARRNYLQEHGLSVRMRDAKNAGIHPLAAMGLPTTGGGGINIPGSPTGPSPGSPSPGMGSGSTADLAVMGQSIGRAIDAIADMVKSKDKQSVPEGTKVTDDVVVSKAKGSPQQQAGLHAGNKIVQVGKDTFMILPSDSVSEGLEASWLDSVTNWVARLADRPAKGFRGKKYESFQRIGPNTFKGIKKGTAAQSRQMQKQRTRKRLQNNWTPGGP